MAKTYKYSFLVVLFILISFIVVQGSSFGKERLKIEGSDIDSLEVKIDLSDIDFSSPAAVAEATVMFELERQMTWTKTREITFASKMKIFKQALAPELCAQIENNSKQFKQGKNETSYKIDNIKTKIKGNTAKVSFNLVYFNANANANVNAAFNKQRYFFKLEKAGEKWLISARKMECFSCRGDGKCNACRGTGQMKNFRDNKMVQCVACQGKGTCSPCSATGFSNYAIQAPQENANAKVSAPAVNNSSRRKLVESFFENMQAIDNRIQAKLAVITNTYIQTFYTKEFIKNAAQNPNKVLYGSYWAKSKITGENEKENTVQFEYEPNPQFTQKYRFVLIADNNKKWQIKGTQLFCPSCKGTGKWQNQQCPNCKGSGWWNNDYFFSGY